MLSSGDEVVRVGSALAEGQVYDANVPMLLKHCLNVDEPAPPPVPPVE